MALCVCFGIGSWKVFLCESSKPQGTNLVETWKKVTSGYTDHCQNLTKERPEPAHRAWLRTSFDTLLFRHQIITIRITRPLTTLLASSTRGMSTAKIGGSGLSKYVQLPKYDYDALAAPGFLKEREKRVSKYA